jgi:hypothetical protein
METQTYCFTATNEEQLDEVFELISSISTRNEIEITLEYNVEDEQTAGMVTFANGEIEDERFPLIEFRWLNEREAFIECVEHYASNGYTFDEFKQIELDKFENELNNGELEEIRKYYEEAQG